MEQGPLHNLEESTLLLQISSYKLSNKTTSIEQLVNRAIPRCQSYIVHLCTCLYNNSRNVLHQNKRFPRMKSEEKIENENLINVVDTVRCVINCLVGVIDISPVMSAHQEESQSQRMVISNYLQQTKINS